MTTEGTLIKVEDPREGVSREEYEAICKALGIAPKPPKDAAPDAK
jgi:hypothetical protein